MELKIENSEKTDFDAGSINSIKSSLMGPLWLESAIPLFWGVWRVVAPDLQSDLPMQETRHH